MNLGPPTNRPKSGTTVPKEGWRPVDGKPWLECNERGQLRTNIDPPPIPVPIVIDYAFDESGFPG